MDEIMIKELKNLKNGLKKKVACGLLVNIACLSMSCTHPKAVLVQQKTTAVPSVKIDTCFVYHKDTAFVFETDTFLIETIIRDTLITQHIETKPYYITTTNTIYIETPTQKTDKTDQKTDKKQKSNEAVVATLFVVAVSLLLYLLAKKK